MRKDISSHMKQKSRAVLFRSGGIGDFILTLPLFNHLQNSYSRVFLVTKPAYFPLINKKITSTQFFDLDLGVNLIRDEIKGADIFTFWNDEQWVHELKDLGAGRIFILPAKPSSKTHIVESMFNVIDIPCSPSFLSKAWIGDQWVENSTLWIHPGSGGKNKNMPFSFFQKLSNSWLEQNSFNQVTFCFGEADHESIKFLKKESLIKPQKVNFLHPSSIENYRKLLQEGVAEFWGNDSGPSHLAANMGIPTNVCFRSTESAIWRPTGPRVQIHEFNQDSS